MRCSVIEHLECRRLLTTTITPVGSPVTVATVPGQYVPLASCVVGTGTDVFLAYVNTKVAYGMIVDGSGAVVVPAFAISPNGQSASDFPMSAVQDSSGNAVLVYGVSSSDNTKDNLYIARISDTGQIVNAPAVVSASSGDQSSPALAMGANNSVAIVYEAEPSKGNLTTTMFAVVLDANDSPAFSAVQISAPKTSASQYLTTPAVVLQSGGNFLAAWNEEDFDSSNLTTNVTISDRTFNPTGVLGSTFSGLTQTPTSSSLNNLTTPVLLAKSDGTTDLFTTQTLYDGSITYQGSNIIVTTINADGSFTSTQMTLDSVTAPNEDMVVQTVPLSSIPTAAVTADSESMVTRANAAGYDNAIVAVQGVVGANGIEAENFADLFFNALNGEFASKLQTIAAAVKAGTLNPDYLSVHDRLTVFEILADPSVPGSSTTIQALQIQQAGTAPPPAFTAAGATSVTAPDGTRSVTFGVTPPPGFTGPASVLVQTDPSAGTAVSGVDFTAISTTLNFLAGQTTSEQVTVPLLGSAPSVEKTFQITGVDPTSGATIFTAVGAIPAANTQTPLQVATQEVAADQTTLASDKVSGISTIASDIAALNSTVASDKAAIAADKTAVKEDHNDPTLLATAKQQLATDTLKLKSDTASGKNQIKLARQAEATQLKTDETHLKTDEKTLKEAAHPPKWNIKRGKIDKKTGKVTFTVSLAGKITSDPTGSSSLGASVDVTVPGYGDTSAQTMTVAFSGSVTAPQTVTFNLPTSTVSGVQVSPTSVTATLSNNTDNTAIGVGTITDTTHL